MSTKNIIDTSGIIFLFCIVVMLPYFSFAQTGDEGVSYIYAKKLYDDEMYNLSAEQFHLFAAENPNHPKASEALFMAGLSYFKSGDYQKAQKEFSYLMIQFPDAQNLDQAQFKIAECFKLTGDYAKAGKAFRQVQIFYPASNLAQQSLLSSAQMYSQDKKFEKATQILLEFLEVYPKSSLYHEAQTQLIEVYIADEKYDLAKIQIDKLLGTTEKGEFNARALLLLGNVHFLQGNLQEAENTFDSLILKYGAEKTTKYSNTLSHAYLKMGEILHRKGLYGKSNENLHKISQFKDDLKGMMLSAENYTMLTNYTEAINLYNEMVAKSDTLNRLKIYFKMGVNYNYLNDYSKAIDSYLKVFDNYYAQVDSESHSLHAQAYLRISNDFLKINQPQSAASYLKNYVEMYKGKRGVDEFEFKIGYLYETKLNDIERAIRIYYDFIDLYPMSVFVDDARYAIARCHEKNGHYSQALNDYRTFLQLYPASDLWNMAISRIEYISDFIPTNGETTKAFSDLLAALPNNKNPEFLFQLAVMNYSQFKDYKTCIRLFSECNSLDSTRKLNQEELHYYWARSYQLFGLKDIENNEQYLDSARTKFNFLAESYSASSWNVKARYHLIEIFETTAHFKDSLYSQNKKLMLRSYLQDFPESAFREEINFELGNLLLHDGLKSSVDSMEIYNYFESVLINSTNSSLKDDAAFSQAMMFLQMGNSSTAEKKLESFISTYPGSHRICEVRFELAKIHEKKGDLAESRRVLEEILSRHFYSSYADSARLKIGALLQTEKKYSEALEYFNSIYLKFLKPENIGDDTLKNNSLFQNSMVEIAECYINLEKKDLARDYLQQYLHHFPNGQFADEVLYSLATTYSTLRAQERDKAIDYLLRLEKNFPQSHLMPAAAHNIADLYFEAGKYEQAIGYYEKEQSLHANGKEKQAIISAQLIICHYRLGQIQVGDQLFKTFRSNYKDEENLLSDIELEKGDYFLTNKIFDQAEEIFKNVRSKYKTLENGAKAEYLLGKLYFILNKDHEALEILTKMMSKYPNDPILPNVYITLGNFYYFQARQVENAMLAYRTVVDFPKIDDSTLKLGMHNLIKCYTDLGLRDQAIVLIRRYINLYPEADDVFEKKVRMGIILSEINEFDQAIQLFQNLKLEADLENEPRIQFWIGECYFEKGQYLKAISEYLKIVYLSRPTKLLPQYRVTAQYKAGLAYLKLSQPENGRQLFEKIVQEQGAESVFGKPALEKIQEIDRLLVNKN
ncbi:MAG: tetratricopeptide repeat protein [Candidatus Zhuqueibacterota bacterium]